MYLYTRAHGCTAHQRLYSFQVFCAVNFLRALNKGKVNVSLDICDKAVVLKTNRVSKLPTEALQKVQMRWSQPRGSEPDRLSCDGCWELTQSGMWYKDYTTYPIAIRFLQDSTLALGSRLCPQESLIFGIRHLKIIARGPFQNSQHFHLVRTGHALGDEGRA